MSYLRLVLHSSGASRTLLSFAALAGSLLAQGGLPPVPVPPENPITPAKAVLGKMLFWEEQLSSDNRVACGTCHLPNRGGADARRFPHPGSDQVAGTGDDTVGSAGVVRADAANRYLPDPAFGLAQQITGRSSPTALVGAWFPELFWDGRARSTFLDPETGQVAIVAGGALENQAAGPILSHVEMAHDGRTWAQVTTKLAAVRPLALGSNLPPDIAAALVANPDYPSLFLAAFGTPGISARRIAFAIATYERTLVPDQTPWDLFQNGVVGAMTPAQVAGMNLFNGAARCNLCHTPGLFSDGQFRNLGVRPIAQDNGRQAVTGNFADRGRFKVPSLRNVGLRTSFMHTGQFVALPQVLAFYNFGAGQNQDNKDPLLQPLGLAGAQFANLFDFVGNALTDPRVQNAQFPFDHPTLGGGAIPAEGIVYGTGSAASGGRVPAMMAAVPANIGNVDFKLGVRNSLGGALATFALAVTAAVPGTQLQGVNIHIDLGAPLLVTVPLRGAMGVAGTGYTTLATPVPDLPALIGITLFGQWFVWDAAVPAGAASSPGAEFRLR